MIKPDLSLVLKRKLPALKRLFESDPRVLAVWLFGSQADETAGPNSDIDLGVWFDRELTLDEQLTFEVSTSETLGTDAVDVVNLFHAKLPIRSRAIRGKLLYEKDSVRVSDFIERTLIEYPDYALFLKQFDEDYFAGLRKDYARFKPRKNQRTSTGYRRESGKARNTARQIRASSARRRAGNSRR